jgi:hypothetical protein
MNTYASSVRLHAAGLAPKWDMAGPAVFPARRHARADFAALSCSMPSPKTSLGCCRPDPGYRWYAAGHLDRGPDADRAFALRPADM